MTDRNKPSSTGKKAEERGGGVRAEVREKKADAVRAEVRKKKTAADSLPSPGKWDRTRDALFWIKLQAVAMCVLLLVLTYFTISTSVKMHRLDRSIELVERDLEQLQMKDVNQAIDSLSAAADNFAKIDMDSFNETVDNLNRVTDSLARVTEALGRIGSIFTGGGGD